MAKETKATPSKPQPNTGGGLAFGRENYLIMIAGIAILALGYILMIGGGSDNPNEFNGEELFSTRRITIAPILLIIGFGLIFWGIMRRPKN